MLVLNRQLGESIKIGDKITVTVVRIGSENVKLGVEAPAEVKVLRTELEERAREP